MNALALWAMLLTTETEIERARAAVVVRAPRAVAVVRLAAPVRAAVVVRTGLFGRATVVVR